MSQLVYTSVNAEMGIEGRVFAAEQDGYATPLYTITLFDTHAEKTLPTMLHTDDLDYAKTMADKWAARAR